MNSLSSTTLGTRVRTSRSSPGSPPSRAMPAYWSRTMPTHDAEGETTTSASPNASTKRRTSGTASSW